MADGVAENSGGSTAEAGTGLPAPAPLVEPTPVPAVPDRLSLALNLVFQVRDAVSDGLDSKTIRTLIDQIPPLIIQEITAQKHPNDMDRFVASLTSELVSEMQNNYAELAKARDAQFEFVLEAMVNPATLFTVSAVTPSGPAVAAAS